MKDEASRIHKQFSDAVNKESLSIASAAKGAGAAIGAMFTVGAASQMINKYAEAETQSARLSQALINVGANSAEVRKQFDEQAAALSKKTAVDDDEISGLQGILVAMTGNVDAAKELTPAVLDLSRGMGISTEAAAKMFAKSNEGAEGLKRAGITIGDTNSELERTHKIAQEVEKRWGGMAEAFGKTPAGKIESFGIALENIEEQLGKILFGVLEPALPGILATFEALAWVVTKTFDAIKVGVAVIMTGLITPLAAVEHQLNILGITSSHVLQNMMLSGINQVTDASAELTGTTEKATGAFVKFGNEANNSTPKFVSMKDNIKNLNTELDKLTPGTKAYTEKLIQVTIAQENYNRAVAESAFKAKQAAGIILSESEKKFAAEFRGQQKYETESTTSLQQTLAKQNQWSAAFAEIDLKNKDLARQKNIKRLEANLEFQRGLYSNFTDAVGGTFQQVLGTGFTELLGNQNSVLEQFLGMMGNNLIAWSAGQLANTLLITATAKATSAATAAATAAEMATVAAFAAPAALAVNIASFGAAGAAAALSFGTAAAAQIAASSAVSLFHEGGTMGSMGERIPLRSDERAAILKVGETVIPTKPGESISQGGGGTVIHLNFNSPVSGEEFIRQGAEALMRKLGVTDISKVFVNNSSSIAIGTI